MRTSKLETHKAQRQHRCSWCCQAIEIDDVYRRYRYYNCDGSCTVKLHPECCTVMQLEARAEGGYFEWTPGQERPNVDSILSLRGEPNVEPK